MIYMFLANGFEEVEALCPLDVMRRAGLDVRTVGIGGTAITGAHGITVHADMGEEDWAATVAENPIDAVILPGGMPGSTNLDRSVTVSDALKMADEQSAVIAAICAAPFILGKRGLLRGRRATCYPGFEEYLEGAAEIGGKVIRDGNIITATGMGVALEFGLELVCVLVSPERAATIRAAVRA